MLQRHFVTLVNIKILLSKLMCKLMAMLPLHI